MVEQTVPVTYRVTVRYYTHVQQYEVYELEAASVVDALRRAAGRIPDAVDATADLVEVRRARPAG